MYVKVKRGNIEAAIRLLKKKREKSRLDHNIKVHQIAKPSHRKKAKRREQNVQVER